MIGRFFRTDLDPYLSVSGKLTEFEKAFSRSGNVWKMKILEKFFETSNYDLDLAE